MATDRHGFDARVYDSWLDWWVRLVFVAAVVVILGALVVTAYVAAGPPGVAVAAAVALAVVALTMAADVGGVWA